MIAYQNEREIETFSEKKNQKNFCFKIIPKGNSLNRKEKIKRDLEY